MAIVVTNLEVKSTPLQAVLTYSDPNGNELLRYEFDGTQFTSSSRPQATVAFQDYQRMIRDFRQWLFLILLDRTVPQGPCPDYKVEYEIKTTAGVTKVLYKTNLATNGFMQGEWLKSSDEITLPARPNVQGQMCAINSLLTVWEAFVNNIRWVKSL